MNILSAEFVKGIVGDDGVLDETIPQIAFIGRSNVGKSSMINCLVNKKDLARISSSPGRTQEINIFLINQSFYLVDLPGYGFAKVSKSDRKWLFDLINWYLFNSRHEQKKIILIIDAGIGPTQDDLDILEALEERKKNIVIVANKIDKIKKSEYSQRMKKIQEMIGDHKIIPFSSKNKIGISELSEEILK